MFICFNPIYFLSACIHMWNYVWVMSCMATCCVLFDLSWAAFCTVQSFAGETCSFERGRGATRQSVDGTGRMALITDDVKQFLLLLEKEDSIRLKEWIIFTLHRLYSLSSNLGPNLICLLGLKLYQNRPEDMSHKAAGPVRCVIQWLSGTSQRNPDMVKNAMACAAVLGDSWRTVTCANLALWGVKPQYSSPLSEERERERELNPANCALIRADTAVLFIIVLMMHIQKKKQIAASS